MGLFYYNIGNNFHLRKIARLVDEEINAVKRELDILEEAGFLDKEKRLNKIIYSLNLKYKFFDEFLRIFTKDSNFVKTLISQSNKLGKIKYLAISLKLPKNQKVKEGEILLLAVGAIVVPDLSVIISEEEKRIGSEINFTVMTEEEFLFRKKSNDPFIWSFLKQPKIMIFGDEEGLSK